MAQVNTTCHMRQAVKTGFPVAAVAALPYLEFEARKDAAQLIGAIVRLDNGGDKPGERYALEHPQLITLLFDGCGPAGHTDNVHQCLEAAAVLERLDRMMARSLRICGLLCSVGGRG